VAVEATRCAVGPCDLQSWQYRRGRRCDLLFAEPRFAAEVESEVIEARRAQGAQNRSYVVVDMHELSPANTCPRQGKRFAAPGMIDHIPDGNMGRASRPVDLREAAAIAGRPWSCREARSTISAAILLAP
jgi:hypothetical protein